LNRISAPESLLIDARALAEQLANGPTFAHAMTKQMLSLEWNMAIDQAIDAEAQAQAICMTSHDFKRAYRAFLDKQEPRFEGD
jgi:enoyl-CoA hydratase/carnithine racemase